MKKASSFALGLAVCALVASALIAAGPVNQTAPQQPSTAASADDPDAGLFAQTCNKCHDGARITAVRRTAADWEDVINKMIERGATGSEKDFETVYEFLLRNFGKLNINVATAADITKIVRLSDKDAAAIVAYRQTNGPFADFEAVRKVPDINTKILDEHKDAVAF